MLNKSLIHVGVFSMLLFLVYFQGCFGERDFAVKDKRELQGNKTTEKFSQDNSRGSAVLAQDVPVKKQFKRAIDLRLNSSAQLDEEKVIDRIYNLYNVTEDAEKVCVIPVEVPAGKNYEYDLEWTEIRREGVVEEGKGGGGDLLGTYEILTDLTCQVVAQRSLN